MQNAVLKNLFFALFFSFFALQMQAQIKGDLKDKDTKENILFANVGLLKTSDSTFVKGAISNEKGAFVIRGVKDGDYILRISYIGYKPFEKLITYKDKLDLGTILLEKSVEILEGVEIVAQRPLYSMDGDKTVYSVEDDPSIQTGTTTDALQNAPGVQVDAEGNITLQGVNCVEIWLNDKPSKIKEDGLKTFLENLPANALQKIEVMTNP
ncbi:MAG: carboxypeptidase-like regulatory domain-containing protein, partial [Bacteroidales bacterium]|nr:carboxypeptidase-like regulatory domain-containing protein [Bacteroidales bacterium]